METEITIKRHSFNDIRFTQTNDKKEIMVTRCSTCVYIGGTFLTITGEQIQELINFALKCNVIDKNFLLKAVENE